MIKGSEINWGKRECPVRVRRGSNSRVVTEGTEDDVGGGPTGDRGTSIGTSSETTDTDPDTPYRRSDTGLCLRTKLQSLVTVTISKLTRGKNYLLYSCSTVSILLGRSRSIYVVCSRREVTTGYRARTEGVGEVTTGHGPGVEGGGGGHDRTRSTGGRG